MADRARVPITFEDVAIYFTEQEWQNLEAWQKELYQHVMRTNYKTLVSLDDRIPKPELISWIEQGGHPFRNWKEPQKSENIICSSADKHFDPLIEVQLFGGSQKVVNSGEIKCHFPLDPQQNIHQGQGHFQYNDCDKSFQLKSMLKVQRVRHTGEKAFSCSVCGRVFTQNCKLRDHLRVHSGEKPFQCPECDKSFRLKDVLKIHQRTHSKERPFSCGKCGKSFTTQFKLTQHFRVHTGEKPFQCSKCDKSFRLKSQLLTHQRLHTGERPFHCPECDKNFRERGHMLTHQRIHKPERPFSCGDCGKGFFCADIIVNVVLLGLFGS
ncbi:zinc finger protein 786-like isoform X2 [Choloepus didactylus]|uniref:zinc finger protein 786-like isoform X2 n=1 Tax=Choloepus didactylus TaxID=27675 RepID=UPI00189DB9A2|nr:zinc finger protein 786-like isoform X2 [Choloepus didactylus]